MPFDEESWKWDRPDDAEDENRQAQIGTILEVITDFPDLKDFVSLEDEEIADIRWYLESMDCEELSQLTDSLVNEASSRRLDAIRENLGQQRALLEKGEQALMRAQKISRTFFAALMATGLLLVTNGHSLFEEGRKLGREEAPEALMKQNRELMKELLEANKAIVREKEKQMRQEKNPALRDALWKELQKRQGDREQPEERAKVAK